MSQKDEFFEAVHGLVERSQPGDLMSYGEVAEAAGRPGAARAVGAIMRSIGADLPWWRVIYANGKLAPGKTERQSAALRSEGWIIQGDRVIGARPSPGKAAPVEGHLVSPTARRAEPPEHHPHKGGLGTAN